MSRMDDGFRFPLQKFDAQHALYSNFRYLEQYLSALSLGDKHGPRVTFATEDSTKSDRKRADVVVDGENDHSDILRAYNEISDIGGTMLFLAGTYIFGEEWNLGDDGGASNTLLASLRIQGEPGAVFKPAASFPDDNLIDFRSVQGASPRPIAIVEGIHFDGDSQALAAIHATGLQAKPHLFIQHNTFTDFVGEGDGVVQSQNTNSETLHVVRENVFRDCTVTGVHALTGGIVAFYRSNSGGNYIVANNLIEGCTTSGSNDAISVAGGHGAVYGNIIQNHTGNQEINIGADVVKFHNHEGTDGWVAGDHSSVDHGSLSGLTDDDHTQYLNETRHDSDDHDALTITEAQITDLDHYDSTDFDTDFATKELDDVSDVDATTPSDDDILRFDSGSGNWQAEALPAAGTHDILSSSHGDVDETDTPAAGDVLKWDNATSQWVAAPADHGELAGLADDDHSQYLNDVRHNTEHSNARWEKGSNQSISDSTTTTVTFGTTVFKNDPNTDFTIVSGVITINTAGVYEVGAGIDWGTSTAGSRLVYILHNSTTRLASSRYATVTASAENSLSTIYEFAVNDTIEVQVRQDSGGSSTVDSTPSTNFWIRKL